MADSKDNESFFRKVVRFVANPATDWHELNSRQDGEIRENELEKSELKAMIERKRRNDFVRKREFDMLRRVRREGLTPEQLAALGTSSRIDDSEVRADSVAARPGGGVKAKIDEIEQEMVGESRFTTTGQAPLTRGGSFFGAQAPAAPATPRADSTVPRRAPPPAPLEVDLPVLSSDDDDDDLPALPPLPDLDGDGARSRHGPASAPAVMASGLPPLAPLAPLKLGPDPSAAGAGGRDGGDGDRLAIEVSEVAHDPDLDEAVIAFANADFEQCEHSLTRLTSATGARSQHAETWLVLFDLFRATGQHQRFESLAVEYAHQFGWSAPQWYSLPQLVADAVADDTPRRRASSAAEVGEVGWASPEVLDHEALSRLRSQTLQMPLPWVFDWSALKTVEAEAATQLSVLCRLWGSQALEMRWIGGDRLFTTLQEAAPTGVRDADPAFWLARLDALRLANRADQFDETAIDYCVTYEVSPPSWEPARCTVHIGGQIGGQVTSTRAPALSMVSDVSTSFLESGLAEDPGMELASVELSGQLIGDIHETLRRLNDQVGRAPMVSVSCARLIRVDFLAAGDLLNWVLSQRGENRTVQFTDAHRLVALFFTAMGISEHATVQVRKV
ncbi:STAS domain-containing protein [Rubrivivax albus]|uniref:STAS domain-containing protein n=1 Tax=Rubrivivax albus TaxID=2499835 RepID=A0A3S2VXV4_9BURK|nr:STAS domain-containing protein [Rubrivivax albus]RVT52318.1 STAS domain-containing protein [Rubrivivax albus]